MASVSEQEKQSMARILALGTPDFTQAAAVVERQGTTVTEGFNNRQPKAVSTAVGADEINAMAKLLQAANAFESEPPKQPGALITEATFSHNHSGGYGWGIRSVLNESTNRVKSFSIMHEGIGVVIADNIKLQETAQLLMSLLNDGATINSQEIATAIYLEKMYVESATKMIQARKQGNVKLSDKYRVEANEYRTEIKELI